MGLLPGYLLGRNKFGPHWQQIRKWILYGRNAYLGLETYLGFWAPVAPKMNLPYFRSLFAQSKSGRCISYLDVLKLHLTGKSPTPYKYLPAPESVTRSHLLLNSSKRTLMKASTATCCLRWLLSTQRRRV